MKMTSKPAWQEELDKEKNRRIVLVFDTSVTGCSICISDGEHFWEEHMQTERGQAEFLVPMINSVLRKSGYTYNHFHCIGVTIGPGSFTGVRVGLSTAKALALSINKPLFGFDTLSVIAKGAELHEDTLVLIDTKRGDFYGQVFSKEGESKGEAGIWIDEAIGSSGYTTLKNAVPNIEVLARMTLKTPIDDIHYNAEKAPAPLYLRGAEISQSKRIAPKIVKAG